MAIIRIKGKGNKHLLLAGVSGQIGKAIVVKQYKDKIVIANYAGHTDKKPTKAQKEWQGTFSSAVAYARRINNDPIKKGAYARKLKGRRTVFQAAISDYLQGNVSAPR